MMKLIKSLCFVAGVALASTSLATSQSHSKPFINLYSAPHANAKIEQKLSPTQHLIPIFIQGKWVKVGNPQNGHVGWINRRQYNQAVNSYFQPDIQTVFIQSQTNPKGKTTLNVIAYKNGKKLTAAEAQKIYLKLRKQQQNEWRNMQLMDQQMEQAFVQQQKYFNHMFDNMPMLHVIPPIWQPVIVIKHNADHKVRVNEKQNNKQLTVKTARQ